MLFAFVAAATALTGVAAALDTAFPPRLDKLADLSVEVTDRDGVPLRIFLNGEERWRLRASAGGVPQHYLDMLVAYEDRRFFFHPGIDPLAVLRAAGQWAWHGRPVSGASTLTMQVARLLEPRPRTLPSKLVDSARALQLEWRYGKRDILGMYLTLAPYGGNVEGVRAGALALFGKPAASIDRAEAALLVALPQNPNGLRPDRAPERSRHARDKVLARAADAGAITPSQAQEAATEALPRAAFAMPFDAPHLAQGLAARHPGPAIRTTLRSRLQRAVQDLARRSLAELEPRASIAVLAMENRTRQVVAYVGGPDWIDDARAGQVDMVRAPRSPGSTLKPFIYAMGFDDRFIRPDTIIADVPTRFGDYAPENFDREFHGDVTVRDALRLSLNIPAVAVLSEIGAARFTTALRAAGARLRFPKDAGMPGLPVALGGVAVSLWDLVALYGALADGGTAASPVVLLGAQARAPVPLVAPEAAAAVTAILRQAPPPTGMVRAQAPRLADAPAVKTGTSYGFRDALAIGYTAGFTVGVWVGRPDGTPSPGRYGRNTAAPILHKVFDLLPTDRAAPLTTAAARAPRLDAAGPARFVPAVAKQGLPASAEPLQLVFPTPGVTIEQGMLAGDALALKARGGRRPLVWLVDGRPIASDAHRREASWRPSGPGFFRVTVLDSDGASASAGVRLR